MANPATMMAMSSGASGGMSGNIGSAELGGGGGLFGSGINLQSIKGMLPSQDQVVTGLASLADLQKRAALQSVLETEGLFRAFGKQTGGIGEAMRGGIGADPIGDQARAGAASDLKQRNADRDKRINALLDKIASK